MKLYYFPYLDIFNNHLNDYPTFSNLNYYFGLGSLAGLCLVIQLITGIFLAMHYLFPFLLCIYIHIGRGIYYKSYYNSLLWVTGIVLFLFLMLTSFLGYILP